MATLDNTTQESDGIANPSVFTQDQDGTAFYLHGPTLANDYEIQSGVCILPLAEDAPDDPDELANWSPVVKLQLHAPYRIRKVAYSTNKVQTPPVLPSPRDTGNFIFTKGTVAITNAPLMDGGYSWTAAALYEFVENNVSRTIDGFVLGIPPFTYLTQSQNANAVGGTPSVPPYGAVAQAGLDPQIGYIQSQSGPNTYNTISYFPGLFFNDGLLNGSLGESPQQFTITNPLLANNQPSGDVTLGGNV